MRVVVAETVWRRLRGLAWQRQPPVGWALLIPRCRSVHTFGMRFPIDIVFLDGHGWPMEIRGAVPRRRMVANRAARAVVELRAGDADRYFVVRH